MCMKPPVGAQHLKSNSVLRSNLVLLLKGYVTKALKYKALMK